MNNFARVLRMSLRYRWSLAGSVACSLIIAVLWGGNIAAVGPIIQVVFDEDGGKSLHTWIDEEIGDARQKLTGFTEELAELERAGGDDVATRRRCDALATRIMAEREALGGYQRLRPWVLLLPQDPFRTLVVIIVFLVIATFVKDLCMVVEAVLTERVAQRTANDLRNQFYSKTIGLSMKDFHSAPPSEWMSRMTNDVATVTAGVRTFYGRALTEPLKALACVIGAMWICWRLFIVSLVLAPISAIVIQKLTHLLKRASRRMLEEVSAQLHVLAETLGSIKIVKAFTMEDHERERFRLQSERLYRRHMRISWLSSAVRPAAELMGIMIVGMAVLCGAYMWLNQDTHLLGIPICNRPLSLTNLLMFFGFLAGISDPARKLSDVVSQLQCGLAASDRVFQVLDEHQTPVDPTETIDEQGGRLAGPVRHARDIVFRGIDFAYTPGTPVLQSVHLRISFGETVAIVGPNGCGKSTLANLLLRFYDPDEGAVLIDGVDVRAMPRAELRRQIGLVTQEDVLFNDTVRNNIRYGSPDATDEQVVEAAKRAHAHRFITEKLEQGYDTVVGVRGGRLSGGQRQRIAFARAVLRDPAILILDEATSQVDLESEQLLHQSLQQFARHRTTLIITHRMSVLALADRIIVMDHGRILDQGDHHELIQRCEVYQRLYQADFRKSA